jgi:hypothetical protein
MRKGKEGFGARLELRILEERFGILVPNEKIFSGQNISLNLHLQIY